MTTDPNIETKVIERFVVKNKRDRYLSFIKKPKAREKFIKELAHFSSQLNGFIKIHGSEWEVLEKAILDVGSPTECYVISENSEIDGKYLSVEIAIRETVGHGSGTLIILGDAELVFYEGEGPSDRWITPRK